MVRAAIAVGVAAAGFAAGLLSLSFGRDGPVYSFAGTSAVGTVALLGAGWALISIGLTCVVLRRGTTVGALLAAAGFGWLLLEWNNPTVGSSAAFTAGIVLYACCAPLVAHAVLAFPAGRLGSWVERVVVSSAYAGAVLLLGLLPAYAFDPRPACGGCPRNLVLIAGSDTVYDDANRLGVWLAVVALSAAAVLCALRLVHSSPAARRSAGIVLAAGTVYLSLAAATFAASIDHGILWNGALERGLWRAQALALLGISIGVGWSLVRADRRRSAVARLVVELAQSPPPGGLRSALAGIVGDDELELAYPLEGSEKLVDAWGRRVEFSPGSERTTLVGGGRPLAVLAHASGSLDDEQLVREVTAAARLALENERLQAEVRARLEELRRARARIVETGDAERRRLEHDLHDGAQQRLAGLALSLRLLRSRLPPDADPALGEALAAAEADLQEAIDGLRELAHGIYPAVLADGGLVAALIALAEESSVAIRVEGVPDQRYTSDVETAAYVVVAETAAAATRGLTVHAEREGDRLVVDVDAPALGDRLDLVELEDRVGAADGVLEVERANGGARIHAEFPCAS